MTLSLPLTLAVLAAVPAPSLSDSPERSARLLTDRPLLLAQAEPSAPPLIEVPSDETPPPREEAPAPRRQGPLEAGLDAPEGGVRLTETLAAGGALLLLDGATLVLGYGFIAAIAFGIADRAAPLAGLGVVGLLATVLGNVVATPFLAVAAAGLAAGPDFRGSDRSKALLYAAAVHGVLLVATLVVSVVGAAVSANSPDGAPVMGFLTLGLFAARYLGIGAAASYGLHAVPPPRAALSAGPSRRPERFVTSPTEAARAVPFAPRAVAVPVAGLAF